MEMEFHHDPPQEELSHLDDQERGLLSFEQVPSVHDFPTSSLEEHLAEKLLTEELDRLSLVEHEKIMFDVHGITQINQEDPLDVDILLQEIENQINKIRKKPAYEHALYFNKEYIQDRSFRLRFLRCDRFDSKLAAQRIVRHFQIKRELFGYIEILGRDVRLNDLSPDDTIALESGFIQVLPTRDAAGRSIFSIAPMHRPETCSVENCVGNE